MEYRVKRRFSINLAIAVSAVMALVVAAHAQPTSRVSKEALADGLTKRLLSNDPAEIDKAIAAMKEALTPSDKVVDHNAVHQCTIAFMNHWSSRLMEKHGN